MHILDDIPIIQPTVHEHYRAKWKNDYQESLHCKEHHTKQREEPSLPTKKRFIVNFDNGTMKFSGSCTLFKF